MPRNGSPTSGDIQNLTSAIERVAKAMEKMNVATSAMNTNLVALHGVLQEEKDER